MFDILIYVVGYETRSAHIASKIDCSDSLAVVVESNQKLNFSHNLEAAKKRRSKLSTESSFVSEVLALIQALAKEDTRGKIRVGLDISSMSREMMALAMTKLYGLYHEKKIFLTILYAPGKYQKPKGNNSSYLDLKPVSGMEGWSLYPERPLSLLIGLGYEEDHAAAATEYFDPSGIWAFIGEGKDKKWIKDVAAANDTLSRIISADHFLTYKPHFPASLFCDLRSLCGVLSEQSRVVVVPGGPKIFSAIAMLVKLEVGDEVAVWRASAHEYTNVRDTIADGQIIRFEYTV